MKLPAISVAVLGASATAAATELRSGMSIDANSAPAHRLLSSSNTRALAEQEEDTTWMVNYQLRFDSCHEIASVGGEAGGREEEGGAGVQRLVKLKLCPKDTSGSSCRNGAEYLVELREFLESYVELKEQQEEQICEYQQNKCEYSCQNQYNNNNNNNNRKLEDAYCLSNCLSQAGFSQCDDNNNNNNNNAQEIDLAEFAECQPLFENNNNNYARSSAYVGAYCTRGGSTINLGVFSDSACTVKSDDTLFQSVYYQKLPYTKTSLVSNDWFSCDAAEYEWAADDDQNNNNNNNNNNYNYEISEMCEQVHERSAKCEKNLKITTSSYNNGNYNQYYPHTESCHFIHSTLSSLESVTKTNGRSLKTARAFAWIFFVTTLASVGYIVYLHKKKGVKIDLSLQGVLGGAEAVSA